MTIKNWFLITTISVAQVCNACEYSDNEKYNHLYWTFKAKVSMMLRSSILAKENQWLNNDKYLETAYVVIPKAFADCMFNRNEFKHVEKTVYGGGIIEFDEKPYEQEYTQANWNALVLYNFVANVVLGLGMKESTDDLIDKIGQKIKDHYSRYSDMINTAVEQIKKYENVLQMAKYVRDNYLNRNIYEQPEKFYTILDAIYRRGNFASITTFPYKPPVIGTEKGLIELSNGKSVKQYTEDDWIDLITQNVIADLIYGVICVQPLKEKKLSELTITDRIIKIISTIDYSYDHTLTNKNITDLPRKVQDILMNSNKYLPGIFKEYIMSRTYSNICDAQPDLPLISKYLSKRLDIDSHERYKHPLSIGIIDEWLQMANSGIGVWVATENDAIPIHLEKIDVINNYYGSWLAIVRLDGINPNQKLRFVIKMNKYLCFKKVWYFDPLIAVLNMIENCGEWEQKLDEISSSIDELNQYLEAVKNKYDTTPREEKKKKALCIIKAIDMNIDNHIKLYTNRVMEASRNDAKKIMTKNDTIIPLDKDEQKMRQIYTFENLTSKDERYHADVTSFIDKIMEKCCKHYKDYKDNREKLKEQILKGSHCNDSEDEGHEEVEGDEEYEEVEEIEIEVEEIEREIEVEGEEEEEEEEEEGYEEVEEE